MPYSELKTTPTAIYSIDATGDVSKGDKIRFVEGVFGGSFKSPKFLGERIIEAEVVNDSYGADKQQHTLTLQILHSEGTDPLVPGTKTTRKGRNVYRNGTYRAKWADESKRQEALDEKHDRGDAARKIRDERRRNQFGSEMSLRSDLIRLATDQPELRRHLIPVLRKHALDVGTPDFEPPPFPYLEPIPGVEDFMLEPTLMDRFHQLSDGAKKFIRDAPDDVKKFILSSEHRGKVLEQALSKLTAKQVLAELKHQIHRKENQFIHAEQWLDAVVHRKTPTEKQKEAAGDIALDLALVIANGFFLHGFLATKIVTHVAKQYALGVAQEIATRVVSETVDDLSILSDIGQTGTLGYKALMAYMQKYPQVKRWIDLGIKMIRQHLKVGSATESVKHDLTTDEAFKLIMFAAVAKQIEEFDHDLAFQGVENAANA